MVVDASVWVSRLVPQDAHHDVSRRWLAEQVMRGRPIIGPVILLAEIAGAISRRTGDSDLAWRVIRAVLQVPTLRLVPIDARLGQESAHLAAQLRLRGTDALYVAVAHMLRVPLVTWDHEQRRRASEFIQAVEPQVGA